MGVWYSRPTVLAKAASHRRPTRSVRVHVSREVLLAQYLDLFFLNGQVCSKQATSYPSAIAAVAIVTASGPIEQLGVMYLDRDCTAEAVTFHLSFYRTKVTSS